MPLWTFAIHSTSAAADEESLFDLPLLSCTQCPQAFDIDLRYPRAQNYVSAHSPGKAKMQGRKEAKSQMRQGMPRMRRRVPDGAVPGPFPVLPVPPRLRHDPSTQPGTPRWTHHHVSRSKQSIGVEAARNFIPAPSILAVLRPHEPGSRFLIDTRAIRILRNPMKTLNGAPV
jgi:hypothetical protein